MKASLVLLLALLGAACTAPGTVPASGMGVSIQNGTTLVVTLEVNDKAVATLQPGDCLGCQADTSVPSTKLPSLPWTVEARSPSGRVLVSMTLHDGDVIETANSSKGDANRIDLSCGRIDIWSGPPLAGPAPGAPSPGDCAP